MSRNTILQTPLIILQTPLIILKIPPRVNTSTGETKKTCHPVMSKTLSIPIQLSLRTSGLWCRSSHRGFETCVGDGDEKDERERGANGKVRRMMYVSERSTAVVSAGGHFGSGEAAQPDARLLLRSPDLRHPDAPRALTHAAVDRVPRIAARHFHFGLLAHCTCTSTFPRRCQGSRCGRGTLHGIFRLRLHCSSCVSLTSLSMCLRVFRFSPPSDIEPVSSIASTQFPATHSMCTTPIPSFTSVET